MPDGAAELAGHRVRMRNLWIPATVFAFLVGHFSAPAASPAPIVLPAPAPTVVVIDKPAPAAPVVWPAYYWWNYPACMTTNMGCRYP